MSATVIRKPGMRCKACQVRYRQHGPFCAACRQAREQVASSAVSVTVALPARGEARQSWWIGQDREAFKATVQHELPRMARSSVAHHLKPELLDHAGW